MWAFNIGTQTSETRVHISTTCIYMYSGRSVSFDHVFMAMLLSSLCASKYMYMYIHVHTHVCNIQFQRSNVCGSFSVVFPLGMDFSLKSV